MDGVVFYFLLVIAAMLVLWIRSHATDQNKLREKVTATLHHSNQLLQLLQIRRKLMTDSGKNLCQNEVQILSISVEIEKRIYALDPDKAIVNNDYWSAFLDHWRRLKMKGFSTARPVLFLQHSRLIDTILAMQNDRINGPINRELFADTFWLTECVWCGIAQISEQLQRIANLSNQDPSGGASSRANIAVASKNLEEHLIHFERLCEVWLAPLNQKGMALDPNLIIRTLSSCERIIRIYQQEIATTKNRTFTGQFIATLINEAQSNLAALQTQQTNYLTRHYQSNAN